MLAVDRTPTVNAPFLECIRVQPEPGGSFLGGEERFVGRCFLVVCGLHPLPADAMFGKRQCRAG